VLRRATARYLLLDEKDTWPFGLSSLKPATGNFPPQAYQAVPRFPWRSNAADASDSRTRRAQLRRSTFSGDLGVTQSCDLACKHCRAAAQPLAHPDQLTTAEGKALIDQIADLKVPIFVFTGGDPLKRSDVFELIRYASDKGVKVAVTPSATPLLTRESILK